MAIEKPLRNCSYFQSGGHSQTLTSIDWMDNGFVCQSCAEKKLGVESPGLVR